MAKRNIEERFWEKVNKSGDCWEWTASTFVNGYGKFGVNGKTLRAHRVSYEFIHGPIPDGLLACHRCDNKICVRPSHIFLGTDKDNSNDREKKGRTARGERSGKAKLTEEKVKNIRKEYSSGNTAKVKLAEKYGVTRQAISLVINSKRWARVE